MLKPATKKFTRLLLQTKYRKMKRKIKRKSQGSWPHFSRSSRRKMMRQHSEGPRPLQLLSGKSHKVLLTLRMKRISTRKTIQISSRAMAFNGLKLGSSLSRMVRLKILQTPTPMKKTRHPWLQLQLQPAQKSSNSLQLQPNRRARKRRGSAKRIGSKQVTEQIVWLRTHGKFCRHIQVFLTQMSVRISVKKRQFAPFEAQILIRFAPY